MYINIHYCFKISDYYLKYYCRVAPSHSASKQSDSCSAMLH